MVSATFDELVDGASLFLTGDLPPLPETEQEITNLEVRLFMDAKELQGKIDLNAARRDAILREFAIEGELLDAKLSKATATIEQILRYRIKYQDADKTLKMPGLGKASLRTVPGKWSIPNKPKAMEYLAELGELTPEMVKTTEELVAKPVLATIKDIVKRHGGVKPDPEVTGIKLGDDGESFKWERA